MPSRKSKRPPSIAQEIVLVKKQIRECRSKIAALEEQLASGNLTEEDRMELEEILDYEREELNFQELELKDLRSDVDVTSAVTIIIASFVFLLYSLCLFFCYVEYKHKSPNKVYQSHDMPEMT